MVDHISEKPRILLLSTAYLPLVGGSELAIKSLTDRMQGYDFDLVTGRLSDEAPVVEHIGRVRVFRVGGRLHRLSFLVPKALMPVAIFFTAWRLARKRKYVLVHAYQASQAAGAAWLLSFVMPKLPWLVSVQEGQDLGAQAWPVRYGRRLILARATAVTTVSTYLADYVRSVTDKPVSVIPNGVPIKRFLHRPESKILIQAREHMGVGPHDRVIVSVSRLVPKNGLKNLIRALPLVREQLIDDSPVLVLIGNGADEGELKHLALLEGVSGYVRFLGGVDHSRLPAYLHSAHVFSRPSLSEGIGNAFLEAMATGTPVVASSVGGISDFLEDGKTGFVCDPHDPQSIADALQRALKGDETKKVADNALQMVTERYEWDNIARSMERVYSHMIHGTRPE